MNLIKYSKVIVQGVIEKIFIQIVLIMRFCGINVVVGISLGEGGEEWLGIFVFSLVEQVVVKMGVIDISVIVMFVYQVLDVVLEVIILGFK